MFCQNKQYLIQASEEKRKLLIYQILIEHHHFMEAMEHRHLGPPSHILLVSEDIKSLAQKEKGCIAFFIGKKINPKGKK